MPLPNNYNPKEAEPRIQKFWEDKAIFKFNEHSDQPIYGIDTPPPTVSGRMHLGHAFSYSQQDFMARYKRMRGFNVFYPFGTDDNGLPTEKLVQKEKKINAAKMGREEFIQLVLDYLRQERPKFIQDWKNIGMSCDFFLLYSTIDAHCRKISQKTFLELTKLGLTYRKEAPVIWDTVFQTAIAQAELEDLERKSYFNDLVFKTEAGEQLVVGTTRPELVGACVALFAHPDDQRYKKYFGQCAYSPLYRALVPILPDEKADPDKGTGLVMCCTFGDQTDIEWYKKHGLPLKMVITKDGRMNDNAGKYRGLKIEEARTKIIEDLKQAKLLLKQTEITQTVNVGERSGQPVEIINSKQWYIKYLDQKDLFSQAADKLNWHPQHMKHRLDNWIAGLNWDWSISRQRKFGVPIPVWYDLEGKIYFADESQLPVDPLKDRPLNVPPKITLIPETDVFDTWFTSASTPFLAINLIKDESLRKKLFPLSLRPQAHDIINFWLFYTLVKTQLLHQANPWKEVAISGWVLDPKGNKMSKSKGNVIAPQEVVAKYSADAIRFWAATSRLGEDLPYQEKDVLTGQKFVTKLWNAAKLALMHLQDYQPSETTELTEIFDKWLVSRLHRLIQSCTESFEQYEFSRTKQDTENFFRHTFCDQYLEIVKDRLYNPERRGIKEKASAQQALYLTLSSILKLMAPITPFITEEIYQLYFSGKERKDSIHLSSWPEHDKNLIHSTIELTGDVGIDIINAVRKWKAEQQLSMKETVSKLVLVGEDNGFEGIITEIGNDLKAVLNVKEIVFSGETSLESEKFDIKIGIVR
ncbi:MAG TPA: valine--tRNA ligase [Candidatus Nanoarchaeia archaeon]|nr:valine--tRNA ligase [Candidatus Nanoarchaeia archaeon]